jgi:hypothetical protein
VNPIWTAAISSILRFVLAVVAGWLVRKGVWSQGEAATYIEAATLGLISVAWSLWDKYHARIKFLTALDMHAGASEADVKQVIADGMGTPLAGNQPTVDVSKIGRK